MSTHHPLHLNGIILLLTLAYLARCVPPPTTQARFNCPDIPAPLAFRHPSYPRLYPFCVSHEADCDCYESPHHIYPISYYPVCDVLGNRDRNDLELQDALRHCEHACSCYEGPTENWSRWPGGPEAIGPRIPITQLHNGYGPTTHSESGSNAGSDSDQQAQARGRLTSS